MRVFWNLVRTTAYLAVAGLVGYYNFEKNGWLGAITNFAFLVLGVLLVATWQRATKSRSGQSSDLPSLNVTATSVAVAGGPERTDKGETPTSATTNHPMANL